MPQRYTKFKCSKTPFSLQYDETTQSEVKKQMELQIRYWSAVHDEVWVRYYSSQLFGHADGLTVANAMIPTFTNDDIPLKQLLTLGSDGPNANKTIWRLLEQKMKAKCPEYNGFVDIGTCNIHIIHNSFGKGIEKYKRIVSSLPLTYTAFSTTLLHLNGNRQLLRNQIYLCNFTLLLQWFLFLRNLW